MNPLILKAVSSPLVWVGIIGAAFFVYYQFSQAKTETLETKLTLQVAETEKMVNSMKELEKSFEIYKEIIEEQNRKLSELENQQNHIEKQTSELKRQVTANSLKQNGLNNKEFEKTINEKSNKMIEELKELSK